MNDTQNLKSYFAPEKLTESEFLKNFDFKIKTSIEEKEVPAETDKKYESEQEQLDYAIPGTEGMGLSWKNALKNEFTKEYFLKVKVVIIGQDPYPGKNQAHGSVPSGVNVPPSLANIYKELLNDISNFNHPRHGYLAGWAKQGVLLLNACLTVEARKANSHQGKGWESLTDAVISWLDLNLSELVFILWGSYAQKKCSYINTCPHPSPLSVHKGFFGCKHFSKANEFLKKNGKAEIDWNDLPVQ
ncbi:hypothetical protein MXB_25 [Myxobolus squamalis]|nr:hypothetical protein MXB_25 [Myxobolus squamalis]